MSKRQKKMINRAHRRYGRIVPCGLRRTLSECFTRQGNRIIFWYNSVDGSTHVETREV